MGSTALAHPGVVGDPLDQILAYGDLMRSRQDYLAAVVLAVVLFGTAGLGLTLWLLVVVPVCSVLWALWSLRGAPRPGPPRRTHYKHP